LDAKSNVLWSWSTRDHIALSDALGQHEKTVAT